MSQLEEALLHVCISRWHRMSEPKLVIRIWLKLILEAKGIVEIRALSSPVGVVEESIVVIFIILHTPV